MSLRTLRIVCGVLAVALIVACYYGWSLRQETTALCTELGSYRDQFNKVSTLADQFAAFVKALPEEKAIDAGNCRAIILASFGFLKKYKSEVPDTYKYAKVLVEKKDDTAELVECRLAASQ